MASFSTPFWMASTVVWGLTMGLAASAASRVSRDFTVNRTRSTGPTDDASLVVLTGTTWKSPSMLSTRRPVMRIAFLLSPLDMNQTS